MDTERVYYYCDLYTFLEIIKKGSIWLTDVQKSNDYMECILCKNRVYDLVDRILEKQDEEIKERWDKEKNLIKSYVSTYCVCFSRARDSLQMWIGYGDNANGIAIGFDREVLSSLPKCSIMHSRTGDVIYKGNEQQEYIERIAKDICKRLIESKRVTGIEMDIDYLLSYPFVKNESFSGEEEFRVVVNSGLSKCETYDSAGDFLIKGVYYKATNKDIVPHFELGFSDIKQQLIREIIIGGKSEVKPKDVFGLLYRYGYYDGIKSPSVSNPYEIWVSKCTYR